MHKRSQSSGCGASRHFFDGPRPPGLPARSEEFMGRQAGETEWAGTTNQAKFSPIGAGSLLPSLALYKKK